MMCKDHKKVKLSVRKTSLEQDTLAHLHPGRLSFIAAPAGRSSSDISSAGGAQSKLQWCCLIHPREETLTDMSDPSQIYLDGWTFLTEFRGGALTSNPS